MLVRLSIIGAVAAILMIPTTLSAQGVGGAVDPGGAVNPGAFNPGGANPPPAAVPLTPAVSCFCPSTA